MPYLRYFTSVLFRLFRLAIDLAEPFMFMSSVVYVFMFLY